MMEIAEHTVSIVNYVAYVNGPRERRSNVHS